MKDFMETAIKSLFITIAIIMALAISFAGGRYTEKQKAVDAGVARWTINEKGEKGFEYVKNAGGECQLDALQEKGRD